MSDPNPSRERLIDRAERYLNRTGSPKILVALLLAATGAVGFLTSFGLLCAGVTSMALRYPLAVAAAYGVFLVLLAVWLRLQRTDDPAAAVLSVGVAPVGPPREQPAQPAAARRRSRDDSVWWFWDFGSGGGGDDGCALVVVVLLIGMAVAGALTACLWVVADAPVLLAELLVDGAVLAAVAPRLGGEGPHWLAGVVRRTWKKALGLALIFALVGVGLEAVEPGAHTMGQAFRMAWAEPHR